MKGAKRRLGWGAIEMGQQAGAGDWRSKNVHGGLFDLSKNFTSGEKTNRAQDRRIRRTFIWKAA